LKENRTISITL